MINDHVFEKEYHKIDNFQNKDIGDYLRNCQNEILEDYLKHYLEAEKIIDWKHKSFNNLIAKRALDFLKTKQ